jgi:hypothetical protein
MKEVDPRESLRAVPKRDTGEDADEEAGVRLGGTKVFIGVEGQPDASFEGAVLRKREQLPVDDLVAGQDETGIRAKVEQPAEQSGWAERLEQSDGGSDLGGSTAGMERA